MYWQTGRPAESLADARLVLQQAEAGQLRSRFLPPARVLLNRTEALEWLREEIRAWESGQP